MTLIYLAKAKIVQNLATPQTININITPEVGTRIKILSFLIFPKIYSANRSIYTLIRDEANNVFMFLSSNSVNNMRVIGPSLMTLSGTASYDSQVGITKDFILVSPFYIQFQFGNLEQNEEGEIEILLEIEGQALPIVDTSSTNVTLTIEEERVI